MARRLGLAIAAVACILAAGAAWVGAAVDRPDDVVQVRVRAREYRPAAARGHICFTDGAHETICALFAAGERPVDSLVRAIERRGLRPKVVPYG
ncbi:MAG: hypothetical protein ACTHKS_18795 [Gaiellaceae bacterium]